VELFGDPALELPGLARARADAWQWGNLNVSGFGAYTMRTEYGLIFGRDEEELGFRRYDPFLTATREVAHALPARLAVRGWRSLFLHPHDLRFYNRHRIMPAAGFAEMVGEEHFAPPSAGGALRNRRGHGWNDRRSGTKCHGTNGALCRHDRESRPLGTR
jgi:hypothetical protein